jgi:hypothetical protein
VLEMSGKPGGEAERHVPGEHLNGGLAQLAPPQGVVGTVQRPEVRIVIDVTPTPPGNVAEEEILTKGRTTGTRQMEETQFRTVFQNR